MRKRKRRSAVVFGALVFLVGTFVISALQSRMQVAALDQSGRREARKLEQFPKEPAAAATPAAVPAVASPVKQKAGSAVAVPMVWEGTPSPAMSKAQVVMPDQPRGLRRPADIDLFIKVASDGRVSSVAAGADHNPALRRAAEDALMKWQFEPVNSPKYRDARVRFRFARSGVRLVLPRA